MNSENISFLSIHHLLNSHTLLKKQVYSELGNFYPQGRSESNTTLENVDTKYDLYHIIYIETISC